MQDPFIIIINNYHQHDGSIYIYIGNEDNTADGRNWDR